MLAYSLPFFFVLLFSTTSSQPYTPTDKFFLSCGSSAATFSNFDKINWDGDEHSKFVPSNISTTSFSSTPDHLDSSVPQIPYSTARIFNSSSFTYTFLVSSQGPKFLRLHFYPATYSGLHTEQSLFSVSCNGYSLLTNFSAFLAVSFRKNTRTDTRIVKEFLIYVKDTQILNITFTPLPNSYAFINGIEIVSMPQNLYFNATTPTFVNQHTWPIINNDTALENVYMLNMGGGQIPGPDDTGMYRSWDQDDSYIFGAAFGLTQVYDSPIKYTTKTPNYTAPEAVYQTQRSMGNMSNLYNLTWILPVDSGFYYMLRLHFCNIIPQYNKSGQVVFRIYINNQTAEDEADLFHWTQGSGHPVFKDYIVFVNNTGGHLSKQDLWLALHPNPISKVYLDAYLNGLEAFKVSMNGNLSSPNPELGDHNPRPSLVSTTKSNKKTPLSTKIIVVENFNLTAVEKDDLASQKKGGINCKIQKTYNNRKSKAKAEFLRRGGYNDMERARASVPNDMSNVNWQRAIDHFLTIEHQNKSAINAAARAKQLHTYRGGTTSYASACFKQNLERYDGYRAGHTDREGRFDSPQNEENYRKLVAEFESQNQRRNEEGCSSQQVNKISIFEKVFGKRRGHTRGLGPNPCPREGSLLPTQPTEKTPPSEFTQEQIASLLENPQFRNEMMRMIIQGSATPDLGNQNHEDQENDNTDDDDDYDM